MGNIGPGTDGLLLSRIGTENSAGQQKSDRDFHSGSPSNHLHGSSQGER